MFDRQHIRHAFGRAADTYAGAAGLQREVEGWLLESLMYLDDTVPGTVVDLGSGPGRATVEMRRRWPKARVVAIDMALPMLQRIDPRAGGGIARGLGLRPGIDRVCADAAALPLADGTVDVLFSNLCLQWVEDLQATFAGFRRVLRPGGLLLLSTFGQDTLHELRESFAQADDAPHVSPFVTIADLGDALMHAGFRDPVLDREVLVRGYDDAPALMRERVAGFRRVLRPGGLLLLSTFGQDTLHELRESFAQADDAPHVSPFVTIADLGDALMHAGFRDPVLDREVLVRGYDDVPALMRE